MNARIIELELTGRCDRTEMSHRSGRGEKKKSTGRCSDQQRSEEVRLFHYEKDKGGIYSQAFTHKLDGLKREERKILNP